MKTYVTMSWYAAKRVCLRACGYVYLWALVKQSEYLYYIHMLLMYVCLNMCTQSCVYINTHSILAYVCTMYGINVTFVLHDPVDYNIPMQ